MDRPMRWPITAETPTLASDVAAAAALLEPAFLARLRAAGLTAPGSVPITVTANTNTNDDIVNGHVRFRRGRPSIELSLRQGDLLETRAVLAHELGHLVERSAVGAVRDLTNFPQNLVSEYLAERIGWELMRAVTEPEDLKTIADARYVERLTGEIYCWTTARPIIERVSRGVATPDDHPAFIECIQNLLRQRSYAAACCYAFDWEIPTPPPELVAPKAVRRVTHVLAPLVDLGWELAEDEDGAVLRAFMVKATAAIAKRVGNFAAESVLLVSLAPRPLRPASLATKSKRA